MEQDKNSGDRCAAADRSRSPKPPPASGWELLGSLVAVAIAVPQSQLRPRNTETQAARSNGLCM